MRDPTPHPARLAVIGLQHLFVMFGATVLVPLLTGLDVGVALFASGVGTFIFHLATRFEMPVYLGSSFAFIPVITAIAQADGGSLAQATGGIAVAGLLYLLVSFLLRFVSIERIHALLPPHVTGSIIILIGLMLAPVAVHNADGTNAPELRAAIGAGGAWALALTTLGVGVFVKVYLRRFGFAFLSTLPVLAALLVGYAAALAFGLVDFAPIGEAAWIGLPHFMAPEFSPGAIAVAVPVALVTMIEHLGDVLAIGQVVGKDFVARPGLSRTLLGDGVATTVAGLLGGPANTTYSENTGTVALTGITNPVVMRIAAAFAITLSFIPKFSAFIATIPLPVVGGISILLFGMIAGVGVKTLVDAQSDLGRPRILIVVATMLVLGLGGAEIVAGPIRLGGLGLAAVVGIGLNALLRPGDPDPPVRAA